MHTFYCSYSDLSSVLLRAQDWDSQNASQIATELCGFVTILSGTFLLHKTKDMGNSTPTEAPVFSSPGHRSLNSDRNNF